MYLFWYYTLLLLVFSLQCNNRDRWGASEHGLLPSVWCYQWPVDRQGAPWVLRHSERGAREGSLWGQQKTNTCINRESFFWKLVFLFLLITKQIYIYMIDSEVFILSTRWQNGASGNWDWSNMWTKQQAATAEETWENCLLPLLW